MSFLTNCEGINIYIVASIDLLPHVFRRMRSSTLQRTRTTTQPDNYQTYSLICIKLKISWVRNMCNFLFLGLIARSNTTWVRNNPRHRGSTTRAPFATLGREWGVNRGFETIVFTIGNNYAVEYVQRICCAGTQA